MQAGTGIGHQQPVRPQSQHHAAAGHRIAQGIQQLFGPHGNPDLERTGQAVDHPARIGQGQQHEADRKTQARQGLPPAKTQHQGHQQKDAGQQRQHLDLLRAAHCVQRSPQSPPQQRAARARAELTAIQRVHPERQQQQGQAQQPGRVGVVAENPLALCQVHGSQTEQAQPGQHRQPSHAVQHASRRCQPAGTHGCPALRSILACARNWASALLKRSESCCTFKCCRIRGAAAAHGKGTFSADCIW